MRVIGRVILYIVNVIYLRTKKEAGVLAIVSAALSAQRRWQ